MTTVPTIGDWLAGKNILVTGSTGYIGLLLVEKILRCCPNINNIYLILRPKRGKSVEDRFQDVLKSDLWTFTKFDYKYEKLIQIPADLSVAGMGLSSESIKTIHDNVNIVFHGAASIKFTEAFDKAVKANTRLTRDMVELAKGIKNLELFVHISTAYVNCNIFDIEEKVYPPHMDWRAAIELAETADPAQLNAVTAASLGDFPNTYTFTKNMAEHVVWDHRQDIPVLIYRPVVVMSLAREPAAGWSGNVSGIEAGYYAIGKGLIRIIGLSKDVSVNVCPGDVTVNGMLVAAWKLACHSKVTGVPAACVVNSNHVSPPTHVMYKSGEEALDENPVPDTIWREYYFHVPNPTLFLILHLVFNVFPAAVIQTVVQLFTGMKLPLTKYLQSYYVLAAILMKYFADTYFKMSYDNLTDAVNELSVEDKHIYDISVLREGETYKDMVKSCVERFSLLLKDRRLPLKERLRQRRLRFLADKICRYLLAGLFFYYFPYRYCMQLSQSIIYGIIDFFLPQ